MIAPQSTLMQRISSHQDTLRVLFILAFVLAAIVLTAVVGVTHTGPSYNLVPDPAGAMPF